MEQCTVHFGPFWRGQILVDLCGPTDPPHYDWGTRPPTYNVGLDTPSGVPHQTPLWTATNFTQKSQRLSGHPIGGFRTQKRCCGRDPLPLVPKTKESWLEHGSMAPLYNGWPYGSNMVSIGNRGMPQAQRRKAKEQEQKQKGDGGAKSAKA